MASWCAEVREGAADAGDAIEAGDEAAEMGVIANLVGLDGRDEGGMAAIMSRGFDGQSQATGGRLWWDALLEWRPFAATKLGAGILGCQRLSDDMSRNFGASAEWSTALAIL